MIYYNYIADLLKSPHCLICGTTGSGKSVLLNNILYHGLFENADRFQIILIDPKRVELVRYANTENCLYYASEPDTMIQALYYGLDIIERRFKEMQISGSLSYNGSDVYIIIDELADLMTTQKKKVLPILQRIGQIGRAARVHMIACTQCPLAKVIPTELKVNFETIIGLHVRSIQDSRNIINQSGCELLPRYGKMIVLNSDGLKSYSVPYIKEEIEIVINTRTRKAPTKKSFINKLKALF